MTTATQDTSDQRVTVKGYGCGVIESLKTDGAICEVKFDPGSFGAFVFPYGGLAFVRRDRCVSLSQVSRMSS